jgi:hypothetical protein
MDSECCVRVKTRIFPVVRDSDPEAWKDTARQISNFSVVNEVSDGRTDIETMDVILAVGEWL